MKKQKRSLYLSLGLIIFVTVITILTVNSTIAYITTKDKIIDNMKKQSKTTILSVKDNISNLIASYSVNEYNNLIYNEIARKDIFAIVIEDYNMGHITGEKSLTSGKIKYSDIDIMDYDSSNEKQNKELENCFYSDKYSIISPKGKKLGEISIYISDEKMKKELSDIIIANVKNSILLSVFLILFLFITIRLFILKPISDIIETIGYQDEDGIPIKLVSNNSHTEIDKLSTSINKMINSIKKSRTILKKEQNRLEYLLELSPIAVRIAKDEKVIFANKAYSQLLKLDTLNTNPKTYYKDERVYKHIMKKVQKGKTIYNQLVELNVDNKTVWALSSYVSINFDGEDAVIGWFYDVTSEKVNENRLYEALELQTTIFNNSGYLIIRTDKDGIIKQINNETEKDLGYKEKELIDKETPLKFHIPTEIKTKAKELSKKLDKKIDANFEVLKAIASQTNKNEQEWTYLTKDGKQIPVMLSVKALKNKDDEVYGYLGIARDISQNKLIESQSRLASMGEMIGNIAHQWRQPLSIISTITTTTQVKNELDILEKEEISKDMNSITEQVQYLSKTIDDFRSFIENKNKIEKVLVSEVIEKTMTLVRSTIKNNAIKVKVDIEDDLEIDAYENQLIQAFINIINNSKDAIKENLKDTDEKLIFISSKKQKNKLIVSIKDNGGGIKKDVINKIFEPYFTTKHKSIGTGIGLSMTYQIINDHHNASIKVANETYTYKKNEYTGANFEITFKV